MGLRRGFKTEANAYARELRIELGRHPRDPLCPFALAAHLELPVWPLERFAPMEPKAVAYLRSEAGRLEFSAVVRRIGGRRVIIYNDANPPPRRAADVAHEIAHCLLLHPLSPAFTVDGARHYNKDMEDEASWLGPALLVSDEAALHVAVQGYALADAADRYGVSDELMRMRLNVSGAYRRARGFSVLVP